jgi:hypothetical protein
MAVSSRHLGQLSELYLISLEFGTAGLGFVAILVRVLGGLSSLESSRSYLFANTLLGVGPTAASSILYLLFEITRAIQCH